MSGWKTTWTGAIKNVRGAKGLVLIDLRVELLALGHKFR